MQVLGQPDIDGGNGLKRQRQKQRCQSNTSLQTSIDGKYPVLAVNASALQKLPRANPTIKEARTVPTAKTVSPNTRVSMRVQATS